MLLLNNNNKIKIKGEQMNLKKIINEIQATKVDKLTALLTGQISNVLWMGNEMCQIASVEGDINYHPIFGQGSNFAVGAMLTSCALYYSRNFSPTIQKIAVILPTIILSAYEFFPFVPRAKTFDVKDMVASAAGSLLAYGIIKSISYYENKQITNDARNC